MKPDPAEQFEALRRRYASQIGDRVEAIVTAWRQLEQSQWDKTVGMEARQLAHKLAGSAAMFGFADLGAVAREIDIGLKEWLEHDQPLDVAAYHALAQQVRLLQRMVKEGKVTTVLPESASKPPPVLAPTPADQPSEPPPPSTTLPQPLALHSYASSSREPNGRPHTIILVEDDQDFAINLSEQLQLFNYDVHLVNDLEGLPTLVRALNPAAIVMDVVFPSGDLAGTESIAAIQRERTVPVPVIYISQRDDFTARLAAVRSGGHAYFAKPVDAGRLIEALDRLTGVEENTPLRVLIVDDDPDFGQRCVQSLETAGMYARAIADPRETLDQLQTFQPDLIILDMYMPICSGKELASVIRQQDRYVGMPIVFLSAETNRSQQQSALSLGADDFLAKPITPEDLVAAISARAGRARYIQRFLLRDSLTGLLNHQAVEEELAREFARAERLQQPLAIVMIDIDHFKRVNDRYGHIIGDQVLRSFARLLHQRLRKSDLIGRHGGEEFLIALPNTSVIEARTLIDGIRESFSALRHYGPAGVFGVTFSAGIAGYPQHRSQIGAMQAADAALYQAKRAGRNRVVVDMTSSEAPSAITMAAIVPSPAGQQLNWRALIISANGIQRRLLRQALTEHNIMYDVVDNVEHALTYESPIPPNLILVDMTQIEGVRTPHLMSLRDHFTAARIVTIAPAAAEPRAAATIAFGTDDYLLLPLAAGALPALLDRLSASERNAL
ncbi:response regulator [uncultured Chloroflexus sp.]|uniref:response regulator n=1 Tax=uncultured Chloroflexus sp. TaxID=214040 RepID=UPI00260D0D56|nr:response regulator [uncultured Chloroflexus sp.]